MKRYEISGAFWALLVVACASGGGSGESETHFLNCTTDLECPTNERCVMRRCTPTRALASGITSRDVDSGTDDASSSGGAANAGGTGGKRGSTGGATSTGGIGGAPRPTGGATSAGGTSGAAGASSGGSASDAGVSTRTDAGGAPGAGGAGGSVADAGADGGPSDASQADSHADALPVAACNVTGTTLLTYTGPELDQIVLDGGYVYFHDSGGVWRVPRSGGSATHLASMRTYSWPNEHAFVVDDSGVTWWDITTSGDGSTVTNVNRLAKTGGPITTLATLPAVGSMPYFAGVLGSAGSVYVWSGPAALQPNLLQIRSDGTTQNWGLLPFFSNGVLFDGTNLFASGQNGISIYEANCCFAGFTGFAGGSLAKEMVLDETTMFIGSAYDTGDVQVYSAPRTGGQTSMLLSAAAGTYLGNLAVDANYLYVVERVPATIVRMNKDGTNPTEFVKGVPYEQISSVAVDDNCVYWALEGSRQGSHRSSSGLYTAPR